MLPSDAFYQLGLELFEPKYLGQMFQFLSSNESFVNSLLSNPTPRLGFCVDGTCCCGKTGLCNNKTSRYFEAPMRNRSPSASLGYVYTAMDVMEHLNEPWVTVWDRKPTNNLDWYRIWAVIDGCDPVVAVEALPYAVEDFYLRQLYTINVVDSNDSAVRRRMLARNEGSDFVRAHLPTYVSAQNKFYVEQHLRFPQHVALFDHAQYLDSFEALHRIVAHLKCYGSYRAKAMRHTYKPLDLHRDKVLVVDPLRNYSDHAKRKIFVGP